MLARILAPHLKETFGNVVVENKPGADGAIGAMAVLNAPRDGRTLLVAPDQFVIAAALGQPQPFDFVRDFAPVGYIGSTPFALLVNPNLKAGTVPEFIALAKSQPGKLTYATGGNGGSQHVASVLLEDMAGISMTHVPYKGSGPALIDLMGGQVDSLIEPAVSAAPHIKSGKVRALALTGLQRSAGFPGVPLVADTVPGFDVSAWFALFAPAKTPAPIVARLNEELGKVLRNPQVVERLSQTGVDVAPGTPAQLGEFLRRDIAKWDKVVKKANITAD